MNGEIESGASAERDVVHDSRAELFDQARARAIPLRVWVPAHSPNGSVVLVSHGMGEDRDTYAPFAREWASRGYIVVALTHRGSDRQVLEEKGILGIIAATRDPSMWRNRPRDVSFVIDHILGMTDLPFVRGAGGDSIAVAGHSAGAFTAAALGGLNVGTHSFRDERVGAIIGLSMPKLSAVVESLAWRKVSVPALHVTGTLDASLQYGTLPRHRRIPFENAAPRGDQFLVTLQGATHSTYSWSEPVRGRRRRLQDRIRELTSLFLDGWLRGEPSARVQFEALGSLRGVRLEHK